MSDQSPVSARTASAGTGSGILSQPGVRDLLAKFASAESARPYSEWLAHPITQVVLRALRDLALNGPVNGSADSVQVQYGMSLGLGIAAQLLDDPSTVFPVMFSGSTDTKRVNPSDIPESFDTTIENVLDKS